ncbi:2-oxo-4-hydroxy-4-carboxy-5-ureidoimidazoline decarboxylase [Acerihabitans sp. TG2]|uniref:2-oxo-4-hydroxy-4-carboxy-5-ureidoimidazoline decarboxylase n=1 Tax=Acerihabitans sp. TG2 TaxID=3096008 RepID=UPI002B2224CA|nr:2-oxo-4-hydroxy-4-carboxy-5-ureidoimidazoline decarboxylase [Acerihabitans sp. TG2]MEA9390160.1 2-oxo-4-hydroxy-4-carboxy-5-ureidoimidazoline decarboxylase [Acerihabitans sp. TG2]
MITLEQFNQLDTCHAIELLSPCVALPAWAEDVTAGRPYDSVAALLAAGRHATQGWQENQLTQALSTHPRIGEPAKDRSREASFSRDEQSALAHDDAELTQALRKGNAHYEAKFGRVFLVRAQGRRGEDILHLLQQRLQNDVAQEIEDALAQLRQITLLRLEGIIAA